MYNYAFYISKPYEITHALLESPTISNPPEIGSRFLHSGAPRKHFLAKPAPFGAGFFMLYRLAVDTGGSAPHPRQPAEQKRRGIQYSNLPDCELTPERCAALGFGGL